MKIKTSELTGVALDYAVAQCEGREYPDNAHRYLGKAYYCPSTDWAFGGPIIEREGVTITPHRQVGTTEGGDQVNVLRGWQAYVTRRDYWITPTVYNGPTPLVAAMRCYVANKLGNEVEIPEELLK